MLDLNPWLPACVALSAVTCAVTVPPWIRLARAAGWVGRDMHKPHGPAVPRMGGVPVLAGFGAGVLAYVAVRTYAFDGRALNAALLAALATTLACAALGLVDDALGWKQGLSQRVKFVVAGLAAVPLLAVGAPLWAPLAVTLSANGFNIMAGFNGLEAGLGLLVLGGLAVLCAGAPWVSVLCGLMGGALLAFLLFNRWPARVFPGNVLTYGVGGLIGAVVVLGVPAGPGPWVLLAPYLLQIALKARGRFAVESFAKARPDGTLENRQPGLYGLEHVAVAAWGRRATERRVVYSLWGVQAAVGAVAVAL